MTVKDGQARDTGMSVLWAPRDERRASWNSTAAGNASWDSASWNGASWNSASRGDGTEDDAAPMSPLTLSASQVAALMMPGLAA